MTDAEIIQLMRQALSKTPFGTMRLEASMFDGAISKLAFSQFRTNVFNHNNDRVPRSV